MAVIKIQVNIPVGCMACILRLHSQQPLSPSCTTPHLSTLPILTPSPHCELSLPHGATRWAEGSGAGRLSLTHLWDGQNPRMRAGIFPNAAADGPFHHGRLSHEEVLLNFHVESPYPAIPLFWKIPPGLHSPPSGLALQKCTQEYNKIIVSYVHPSMFHFVYKSEVLL